MVNVRLTVGENDKPELLTFLLFDIFNAVIKKKYDGVIFLALDKSIYLCKKYTLKKTLACREHVCLSKLSNITLRTSNCFSCNLALPYSIFMLLSAALYIMQVCRAV